MRKINNRKRRVLYLRELLLDPTADGSACRARHEIGEKLAHSATQYRSDIHVRDHLGHTLRNDDLQLRARERRQSLFEGFFISMGVPLRHRRDKTRGAAANSHFSVPLVEKAADSAEALTATWIAMAAHSVKNGFFERDAIVPAIRHSPRG